MYHYQQANRGNYTTTFQCVVHSEPKTATSTLGTITVTGMLISMCMY